MTKQKRTKSWWEPVFSKEDYKLTAGELNDVRDNQSVENLSFNGESCHDSQIRKKNVTFTDCDFEGNFSKNRHIFDSCSFIRCDFGSSEWKVSKFRSCYFDRTSFSISTFYDCELRDCKFSRLGFSGNTTDITKTLITNPAVFIHSADIFKNQIPDTVSHRYQRAHLLVTQSTLSRIIMNNLLSEGSEESYYEAVKCRTIMAARARYAPKLIHIYGTRRRIPVECLTLGDMVRFIGVFFSIIGARIEEGVLRTLGAMNAWGASVSRSVLVGALLIMFFSFLHAEEDSGLSLGRIIQTGETFFLFGYTNHSSDLDMSVSRRMLFLFNGITGLVWYAVFITTVINKLTRQR